MDGVPLKLVGLFAITVLLACFVGFVAGCVAGPAARGAYPSIDIARSWWTLNVSQRQTVLSWRFALEQFGIPLRIVQDSDAAVLMASIAAITSTLTAANRSRAIAN